MIRINNGTAQKWPCADRSAQLHFEAVNRGPEG
jgi:hypothetical protein